MLDWLIIGGGIHGTHLSHYLVNKKGVSSADLRLLDPQPQLLDRWRHLTQNTGMQFMRSSRVHHIDLQPSSMDHFCEMYPHYPAYAKPYHRPSYQMFQDHADYTIQQYDLAELHLRGQATHIACQEQGFIVESDNGSVAAKNVVLAIGRTHLHYPTWAASLRGAGASIHHLFEMDFRRADLPVGESVVIVGGGITAAQAALALAESHSVTLLMRHSIRLRDLDADPGWMGPKELKKFKKKDMARRRILIQRARHRGSIPRDVYQQLHRAFENGQIRLCRDEIMGANLEGSTIQLQLHEQDQLTSQHVVLATGFDMTRPGGEWLDTVIEDLGLRCATCGYPILNTHLQWTPGLFVSGPLAELQVGPIAPNIIGARMAAQRIGRGV